MVLYKPVKIMFDIEDEYQLKLYEHLKKRSNGSSYIRTLIHLDLSKIVQQTRPETIVEAEPVGVTVQGEPLNEVINEQSIVSEDDIILDGLF